MENIEENEIFVSMNHSVNLKYSAVDFLNFSDQNRSKTIWLEIICKKIDYRLIDFLNTKYDIKLFIFHFYKT